MSPPEFKLGNLEFYDAQKKDKGYGKTYYLWMEGKFIGTLSLDEYTKSGDVKDLWEGLLKPI